MEEGAQIKVLSKTIVFLLLPSNFHCSDGCRRLQTAENAVFSRTAVAPKPDERWLLVTFAALMHCDWLFPSGRFLRCSYTVTDLGYFAIPVHRSIRFVVGPERLQIE